MKYIMITILALVFAIAPTWGQDQSLEKKLLKHESSSKLQWGGYGGLHFNKDIGSSTFNNANLDVHRLVLLLGYRFNSKWSFVSEIEYEHIKEVYVEQAFVNYRLNNAINFKAGLILIPVGNVNINHEPTNFMGTERPWIDKGIIPTTWRELGMGFSGNILDASLSYQIYAVNGFLGYDGSAKLSGSNGLRKGRQKGAESMMTAPDVTARLSFYGIKGLTLGASAYVGNTETSLYNNLDKKNAEELAKADSSVVGLAMIGFDAKYTVGGLAAAAQLYQVNLSNTQAYNAFGATDLGSAMQAYYIQLAYNVFQHSSKLKTQLSPFIRFSQYNKHQKVASNMQANKAYAGNILTYGLQYKATKGLVINADIQQHKTNDGNQNMTFNAGFGFVF